MRSPPLNTLIEVVGKAAVRFGAVALIAFGALTAASIAVRSFGGAITGSAEINEMLVICMAAMSLVAATVSAAHPRVTMLVERLRSTSHRRLIALVSLLSGAFWALAAFVSGRVAIENARLIEETDLLRISVIPFRVLWTIALALVALILIARALRPGDAQCRPEENQQ